jgi:hypothetical protein
MGTVPASKMGMHQQRGISPINGCSAQHGVVPRVAAPDEAVASVEIAIDGCMRQAIMHAARGMKPSCDGSGKVARGVIRFSRASSTLRCVCERRIQVGAFARYDLSTGQCMIPSMQAGHVQFLLQRVMQNENYCRGPLSAHALSKMQPPACQCRRRPPPAG